MKKRLLSILKLKVIEKKQDKLYTIIIKFEMIETPEAQLIKKIVKDFNDNLFDFADSPF